jgi:cell division control protein 11
MVCHEQAMLPFAVIGSEEEVDIDGEPVRARVYPWGVAEVDNTDHSDFSALKSAILGYVCQVGLLVPSMCAEVSAFSSSHLYDLKSLTEDVLYETYRTEKLSKSVSGYGDNRDSSILPEDMANQSVRIKEEQLRKEEEKVGS